MTPTHVVPHDDHYALQEEDDVKVYGNDDVIPGIDHYVGPVSGPRETRRSMAVIVYGAFAAGGALVGLVAGWVLRGMW